MDAETLKQKYGRDLVFWGGGVDTQQVLPFGTPDEVREQVLRRCEAFYKDGGFVFQHRAQYSGAHPGGEHRRHDSGGGELQRYSDNAIRELLMQRL
jgi:hypothetical protein